MTKEVILSIKGLQTSPDQDTDTVEVIAPGEYYFKNDKHYVVYDEVNEGDNKTTKNVIKFKDDYMEVTKRGTVNVHMIFEKNKKNVTYYYTPYGSLLMGIEAESVSVSESESFIRTEAKYELEMNYEHLADCNISIEIKPKGSKDFKLIK